MGRNLLCVLLAAGWVVAPSGAGAESFTLRIGAPHPANIAYTIAANDVFVPTVTRRVREETTHSVRFIKAWAGTAAPPREHTEAISKGILDIGGVASPFEQAAVPLFNYAYGFAFATPDPEIATRVGMRMIDEVPELQQSLDRWQVTVLAHAVVESYGVNTMFPVDSLAAFKGRRIGVAGSNAPWMEAVGSVPVNAVFTMVYQSMQTGVMDGLVTWISPVVSFKLYQPAKYFIQTDFGSLPTYMLVVNNASFARLPADVRGIIREEAVNWAFESARIGKRKEADAIEVLRQRNFEIIKLEPSLRREWAALLRDIPNRSAQRVNASGLAGTKVWRAYLRILEEEGYEFPAKIVID